jgi:hypothetical protein
MKLETLLEGGTQQGETSYFRALYAVIQDKIEMQGN